jgi:DeoR/GlpR family transcriptional regulator of sugar metabolism/transposase
MSSPKLEPLTLSDRERRVLEECTRRRATGQALALRSRIVLACADGTPVSAVAGELGISRATVAKWRSRFLRGRMAGLSDESRPGRPRTITDERVEAVISATLRQAPPAGDAHWSTRSMARQVGMSQTAISRIWRAFGLEPRLAHSRPPGAGQLPPGTDLVPQSAGRLLPDQARGPYWARINDSVSSQYDPPGPGTAPAYSYLEPRGKAMLAAERRDLLLARLRRDGKLVARDLAQELGLSEDSVRRDLRELAAAGLCQRVYGGALPVSPAVGLPLAVRSALAPESKRRVGMTAAGLIAPGTTAVLDGGTTALEVVAALRPDLDATIITPSATTAAALAAHPRVNVLMIGGRLSKQAVAASGAIAAEAASGITADLALLILPGIHPDEGLTHADSEAAALTRILISRAAETYVMASIEKLGTVCAYKITGLSEVAGIITDAPLAHPTVRQLSERGANIIQAV